MAATQFLSLTQTPVILEQALTLTSGEHYAVENLSGFPIYYYKVASNDPDTLDASTVFQYGRIIPPRSADTKVKVVKAVISVEDNIYTWIWTSSDYTNIRVAVDEFEEASGNVYEWAEEGNMDTIPSGKLPAFSNLSGLTQDQVDVRIRALVQDWAETGDNTVVPNTKISNVIARVSQLPDTSSFQTAPQVQQLVKDGVYNWAEQGNTDRIPDNKLPSDLARGGSVPDKATDGDVDAETDDTKYTTVLKVFRAIGSRVKSASQTVVGITRFATDDEINVVETSLSDDVAVTPQSWWKLLTGTRIKFRLESLTGNNKLDYSALKNVPSVGLNQSQVDARITTLVSSWARDDAVLIPDNQIPAGVARQSWVGTQIQNHANLPNVHHTPPTSGGNNGGNNPVNPSTTFMVTYGLADNAGTPDPADTAQTLTNALATFDLVMPITTATGVRWYFTLPSGRTVDRVYNTAIGRVNTTSDWSQVVGTQRWYYSGALAREGRSVHIQVVTSTS